MTKFKYAILSAAIGSISATSNVYAKDGFSIGVSTSNSSLSHSIERNTGSNLSPSIISTSEETDFGGGVQVAYQFHISDAAFLGVEAFYQDHNVETRNINNLLVTDLTLNEAYGLKLKAGFDVTDTVAIYGLIGQTTLDFDVNNSYTFAPPMRTTTRDEDEFTIGFGAQVLLSDHWQLNAEYSQLNDLSFEPLPEVAVPGKINPNELDFSQLSVSLNYVF